MYSDAFTMSPRQRKCNKHVFSYKLLFLNTLHSWKFWMSVTVFVIVTWLIYQIAIYQLNIYRQILSGCVKNYNAARDLLDNPVCRSDMEIKYSQYGYVNCTKARMTMEIHPESCAHQKMWDMGVPMRILTTISSIYGDQKFLMYIVPIGLLLVVWMYIQSRSQERIHRTSMRYQHRIMRQLRQGQKEIHERSQSMPMMQPPIYDFPYPQRRPVLFIQYQGSNQQPTSQPTIETIED